MARTIKEDKSMPLCPWKLTLPSGSTAHFTTKDRAEDYEAWIKTQEAVDGPK